MMKVKILDEYVFLLSYKQLYYGHNVVEQQYFNSGILMAILIVSIGIIIENQLQMYPIMGGGNVNTWHELMYVHCALVATQLLL